MKLKHVNRVKSRGRVYWYWRPTGERLPDDEVERVARWTELMGEPKGATARPVGRGSMAALVDEYKGHEDYKTLSASTRRAYEPHLERYRVRWHDLPVREFKRSSALKVRDTFADRPATAKMAITVLRELMAFACERPDRYGREDNPCLKIRIKHKKQPTKPWPAELIQVALERAYPQLRFTILVGLHVVQRNCDVVKADCSDYRDGWLYVAQRKTGVEMEIPIHPDFRAEMDAAVKDRIGPLCVTKTGRRWTGQHLRSEIRKLVKECGYPGYVFHGLRVTTCINLVESGATNKQGRAMSGHQTDAQFEGYTRLASQKRLAEAAVSVLQNIGNPTAKRAKK